jgi:branched-subunit amino acid ABC-type transport system permease component
MDESPMIPLRMLKPEEELLYLKEIHGNDYSKLFSVLIGHFEVLQSRAQMLLGLIAICLTITGFSGPNIAASGAMAKWLLAFGLSFVLMASFILVMGPLQLRWGTQRRADSVDQSLVALINIRNRRTKRYHIASAVLVAGLSGYMGSLLSYMLGL